MACNRKVDSRPESGASNENMSLTTTFRPPIGTKTFFGTHPIGLAPPPTNNSFNFARRGNIVESQAQLVSIISDVLELVQGDEDFADLGI